VRRKPTEPTQGRPVRVSAPAPAADAAAPEALGGGGIVVGGALDEARVASFAPIAATDARVLVLGSMPGVKSLQAAQYYAHPRNLFWPLLGQLFGFDATQPYAQRVDALLHSGIALWDVLASCRREGSLDARIDRQSEVANDIPAFLDAHPNLRAIALNGRLAEQALLRHFPGIGERLPLLSMPSTSPANASVSIERKRAQWAAVWRVCCNSPDFSDNACGR